MDLSLNLNLNPKLNAQQLVETLNVILNNIK